jgi:penicillin-binding protein 1A
VYIGYDQPRPMGHAAQGGRIAAPIFKQWAQVAFKDKPKVPFVAPAGIRWVRVDRASGKRVFGVFPTKEDPKSSVIWEAFQPQTEPRRSYRRGAGAYSGYDDEEAEDQQRRPTARRTAANAPQRQRPRPRPARRPAQDSGLPTQNGV